LRYWNASCSSDPPYGNGTANFERGWVKAMPERVARPATAAKEVSFASSAFTTANLRISSASWFR
jgi:hypothetical protein